MKRGLQILLAIMSLIPLSFGIMNMVSGAAQFIPLEQVTAELDSQFRFQSAYYFGLAIIIWWVIPNLERHKTLIRILIGVIFLGGLARVYSYISVGPPPPQMFAGMILELSLPLLLIWLNKIEE